MKRTGSSGTPARRNRQPAGAKTTIKIAVPDDFHDYALVREEGESEEAYEERKKVLATLLRLGGR
jgi:hypothetical protein